MFWIMPLLIFLSGCLPNVNQSLSTGASASNNVYNLSRVSVGMNEAEVLQIMRHAYNQKSFEYGGDVYDVWFYITRVSGLDQSRMVPQNLTPLIFKNGILLAWGFDYYHYLIRQKEGKANAPTSPKERREDIKLEKVLETPTPPQTAAPSKKAPAPSKQPTTPSEQPNPGKIISDASLETHRGSLQAMCSRPSSATAPQPVEENSTDGTEEKPYLDEEGEKMKDEENDQNFDFW